MSEDPDKQPKTEEKPQPQASGVEVQLEQINQNLSQINKTIEEANPKQEPPKSASRWMITLASAFLGLRMFGKIGAQLGLAYNAYKTVRIYPSYSAKKTELLGDFVVNSTIFAGVGAAILGSIGSIITGIVGYNNAPRIKDINSLTKNPLSSMAILFGKEEAKTEAEKPVTAESTSPNPQAATNTETKFTETETFKRIIANPQEDKDLIQTEAIAAKKQADLEALKAKKPQEKTVMDNAVKTGSTEHAL